jgi:ABC-type dipeptide/oligopeptide/nickel transport system permease component
MSLASYLPVTRGLSTRWRRLVGRSRAASILLPRLGSALPVLLLITVLVFLLVHAAPGGAASMLVSQDATPEDVERLRHTLGLDQPLYVQYLKFLMGAAHGDLGTSFRYGEPVARLIGQHLPATLELALVATLLAAAIGIPLGMWAGARPNSWIDNLGSLVGFFGISMPSFWMGIMLILVMAGYLDILPTSGRTAIGLEPTPITGFLLLDTLLRGDVAGFRNAVVHIILPAVALSTNMIGIIMRVTRSSVIEIMHEDYVTTARAKGQTEHLVLWRHVLKNALVVIVTVVGLELGALLSGSIIVETVFVWPGMGSLLIEALQSRDYPMIIGIVLVYASLFVLINVLIDLFYAVIDPRVRFG